MAAAVLRSILLVASVLTTPGWAASPLAPAATDRAAKLAAPPPGRALLYVFNTDAVKAPPIWVDGREAGSLDAKTFLLVSVTPGRHELRLGQRGGGIAITVNAGRAYFVQQSRAGLKWVPDTQGRKSVQKSRLLEDRFGFSKTLIRELPKPVAPPPPAPTPSLPKPAPPAPPAEVKKPKAAPAPAEKPRVPEARAGTALILKTGAFRLSNETQDFVGTPVVYDASSSSVFGVELEWRMSSGIAFGGEFLTYSNDINVPGPPTGRGAVDVTVFLANAKKYFATGTRWHPYIGAGIGVANADFSGDTNGSGSDLSYQAMAGFDLRWDKVGLYAELKYLSADTEDDAGNKADVSGTGVFLGVSIRF